MWRRVFCNLANGREGNEGILGGDHIEFGSSRCKSAPRREKKKKLELDTYCCCQYVFQVVGKRLTVLLVVEHLGVDVKSIFL